MYPAILAHGAGKVAMLAASFCREVHFTVLSSTTMASRVPRCLFGKPNSRETVEMLHEALDAERSKFAKRWGVDPRSEDKENNYQKKYHDKYEQSPKKRSNPYSRQTSIHGLDELTACVIDCTHSSSYLRNINLEHSIKSNRIYFTSRSSSKSLPSESADKTSLERNVNIVMPDVKVYLVYVSNNNYYYPVCGGTFVQEVICIPIHLFNGTLTESAIDFSSVLSFSLANTRLQACILLQRGNSLEAYHIVYKPQRAIIYAKSCVALAKERWNFDFEKEEPLPGRYVWVKLDQHGNEIRNPLEANSRVENIQTMQEEDTQDDDVTMQDHAEDKDDDKMTDIKVDRLKLKSEEDQIENCEDVDYRKREQWLPMNENI
ncbi:hypothetical protein APICC_09364 [Apis cerana cerana]|uniref:Cyclin-dependent kinase inhibitor domain-containing protein n=1 Tax=Apis cerana cerana TaxID=94128 RepID=A0A2A3ER81_APICC|nr:hypothetical protein APICC_09364 [Apis cerana cerana]